MSKKEAEEWKCKNLLYISWTMEYDSKLKSESTRKGKRNMPLKFSEEDLKVIGKIQETRNCTIEHAKTIFRQYVLKLANPDIPNRADLVLAAFERKVEFASDEEVEESVSSKKPTRNEKRLAKRESRPKKAKTPKTSRAPRVEVPLPKLEREIELLESETPHVYTANLFGKKHAVLRSELNHAGQGAKARFGPVDISARRLEAVTEFAKKSNFPVAICVTVRVGGRLDQGYAVPFEVYEQFKRGKKDWFTLSGAARAAYAEKGWAGCKFIEKAADTKAA